MACPGKSILNLRFPVPDKGILCHVSRCSGLPVAVVLTFLVQPPRLSVPGFVHGLKRAVAFAAADHLLLSQISAGGKTTSLGDHDTEIEAARAFDRAAINKAGASAKTNFSLEAYADEFEDLQGMSSPMRPSRDICTHLWEAVLLRQTATSSHCHQPASSHSPLMAFSKHWH